MFAYFVRASESPATKRRWEASRTRSTCSWPRGCDGIEWQRGGGRNPFLRLGPPNAGDSKIIYAFTQPVQVGDELWIYYGGFRYGISEGVALKRGAYFRARLRLDGFVSVDAPYESGELVTVPLRFRGERLALNADTSAGGAVRV